MEPSEAVEVDGERVACDGGGADGHPRVFLSLRAGEEIACPYCGRRFVRRTG